MPAPKGQPKPQPKGTPKQSVTIAAPMGNVTIPKMNKQPPMPKAIGKQQAYTPEKGIYDKLKKNKQGDLAKPAAPDVVSIPLMNLRIIETDGDRYLNSIPLPDGSVYTPPIRKRTY